jgi:hypothetical protein
MKMILSILPKMQLSKVAVTKYAIYQSFVESWSENERLRLRLDDLQQSFFVSRVVEALKIDDFETDFVRVEVDFFEDFTFDKYTARFVDTVNSFCTHVAHAIYLRGKGLSIPYKTLYEITEKNFEHSAYGE